MREPPPPVSASDSRQQTVRAAFSGATRAECRPGRDTARTLWASLSPQRSQWPAWLTSFLRRGPTAATPLSEFVSPGRDRDGAARCLQQTLVTYYFHTVLVT